jgi:hypothetical protein
MKISPRRISALLFGITFLSSAPANGGAADYYWSSIHVKQNDQWYIKQNTQYLKISFNNILVDFKDRYSRREIDSVFSELHCTVERSEARNRFMVRINSSTEYFHFLQQASFMGNIENISVRTLGSGHMTDSLITEIRVRGKIYIKEQSRWYMSQGGNLYEILEDMMSLKFKSSVKEEDRKLFLMQNRFQLFRKDRLDIWDVQVPASKHAIFYFIQLYRHPLLDFVEITVKTGS